MWVNVTTRNQAATQDQPCPAASSVEKRPVCLNNVARLTSKTTYWLVIVCFVVFSLCNSGGADIVYHPVFACSEASLALLLTVLGQVVEHVETHCTAPIMLHKTEYG